ncbi:MAG TPA: MFS transporter [Capsulimonadaceae bacterium]|nr:MFS transporter [Capsulimonadaceae bacterium]
MSASEKEGKEALTSPAHAHDQDLNWWILVAVGIGTFMSALDGSVVNIILPVLTRAFRSSVSTIEWVVTIYLLITSALVLMGGRWGDLHGHKKLYIPGFVVFILGSALCGLSPSAWFLVAFRGVQALGATMLFASSGAILTLNFPANRRGQVLGLQGTMTYLGLTVGPLLGGWLTDAFGWRSVFYINVPVGLLALALSVCVIPNDKPQETSRRFDLMGAGLFFVGLVALLIALNQAHTWGSWPILSLLALAAVALGVFGYVESCVKNPMLDLTLFKNRLFSFATISSILNFICVTSLVFLLPFYLIEGRGYPPGRAGMILTAQPLVMAVVAPLAGRLSDHIGTRIPGTLGMAILAAGLFLLSRVGPHEPIWHVILGLGVTGFGTGIFIAPNNSALMGGAPRRQQGIANAVRQMARNLGNVLGIGIAGAIFNHYLAHDDAHRTITALFHGVGAGLAAACLLALIGTLTSAARGR